MGRRKKAIITSSISNPFRPLVRHWALKALAELGGHKNFIQPHFFSDTTLADWLGLGECKVDGEFSSTLALETLRDLSRKNGVEPPKAPERAILTRNLQWIGDLLGLSTVERQLLLLLVLHSQEPTLCLALDLLGNLSAANLVTALARLLGVSYAVIQEALRPTSALATSGLLAVDMNRRWDFSSKIELQEGLGDRLWMKLADPHCIFANSYALAPEPRLGISDYHHLHEDLGILTAHLGGALKRRQKGVNVLIHGVPGTGKTQFARALAQHLGTQLFEVATENMEGQPIPGPKRFQAYRLSQATLRKNRKALVLFDEVEDVFQKPEKAEGILGRQAEKSGMKGWINRILEENPIPAIWITNRTSTMDEAYLRRFDYVLAMEIPPRKVRARILDTCLGDLSLGEMCREPLVAQEDLAPAVVARAVRVVQSLPKSLKNQGVDKLLTRVVANTMEVMGAPMKKTSAMGNSLTYRPELLQTDCDLEAVKRGLRTGVEGRLCLYGPPGTGKSAFGRHLADVLERPLLVKRASDLQSMWVGETEKNMARMFREASAEQAVLLLDEADSFLQDRQGAQRSWEISQVNEMLTQMEGFEGIFIASTNLMGSLDSASLRRFDLKIRFDYLKAAQAWSLCQDLAGKLGIQTDESLQQGLAKLSLLTPGDFANVLRQARLRPITDAADLLDRLRAECQAKPQGRQRVVGF
ncbi:AAA family ATPase [Holophaga foetida]|uniref:AAA family ATPase n=1 Tax=Holophaga foetida TaxID=35839 RepID=UPI000247210D|nr:ATP-binding protein [Holophaga foetida]